MDPVDTQERVEVLQGSLIFSALSQEELGTLAHLASERCFAEGDYILWEGDAPLWFYIVERGKVKIVKHSPSGKEFIINVFTPGEMFGEVAVFEGRPYPASAQAMEETCVLGVGREDLLSFLSQNPSVTLKIIRVLGERLKQAHNRLRDLAGERVEQRIAGILLMLASKLGPELPFTRQDIADMSGTAIETAIRVMSRFGKARIVRSSRGRITILNEARLRLISQGSPGVSS
ncbi:MAG: Crp/Fnr family transcriptional regulator [Dehalococcoidia bacterium]